MDRYLFFDVETPNRRNDRICELGIIVEENGQVIFESDQLINPEVEFDSINIDIHGICPADVKNSPTFPEVWKDVREYFISSTIVGHNVAFDLGVLEKTLNAYGLINDSRDVNYECTLLKSRQLYSLPHYGLNDVCGHLGIVLDNHHDALCDARAAMAVYRRILESSGWDNYDVHTKRFIKASNDHIVIKQQKFSSETVAIRSLKDILNDIVSDNVVSERELYSLNIWMEQLDDLKDRYPFNRITELILQVMQDGYVSESENEIMLQKFSKLLDPVSCHTDDSTQGSIDIRNKTCCITGNCTYGSRSQMENRIVEMGGIPVNTVTKKTDVLIVGGEGSTAWAFGNYGSKVKKALQYQTEGLPIKIVGEKEVFSEKTGSTMLNREQDSNWIDKINGYLKSEVIRRELPMNSLHLMKNISKKDGVITSYSVCIYEPDFPETKESKKDDPGRNSVVLNLKPQDDGFELSLNSIQFTGVGNIRNGQIKQSKEDTGIVKVKISDDMEALLDYLRVNLDFKLKTYRSKATAFGCCNLFRECSDAKKCIHENKLYSTSCYYRHHLDEGEIFYGKNKNI